MLMLFVMRYTTRLDSSCSTGIVEMWLRIEISVIVQLEKLKFII